MHTFRFALLRPGLYEKKVLHFLLQPIETVSPAEPLGQIARIDAPLHLKRSLKTNEDHSEGRMRL